MISLVMMQMMLKKDLCGNNINQNKQTVEWYIEVYRKPKMVESYKDKQVNICSLCRIAS